MDDAVRIDKWLWAARFFRTRALAAQAAAGGKVKVNGERAKPAKTLRVGDAVTIHIGPYEYDVRVRALSEKRGPASQAAQLYEESAQSKAARETLRAQLAAQRMAFAPSDGRPDKRERRDLVRLKKSR